MQDYLIEPERGSKTRVGTGVLAMISYSSIVLPGHRLSKFRFNQRNAIGLRVNPAVVPLILLVEQMYVNS